MWKKKSVTGSFKTNMSVKDVYSLLSALIYIESLSAGRQDSGIKINGRKLNHLRYVDDIVLMAKSVAELQELLTSVCDTSKEYSLRMNIKKTKAMVLSRNHEELRITCDGKIVEQVSHFKYLGTVITETTECQTEIRARLGQGRRVVRELGSIWKSISISLRN